MTHSFVALLNIKHNEYILNLHFNKKANLKSHFACIDDHFAKHADNARVSIYHQTEFEDFYCENIAACTNIFIL